MARCQVCDGPVVNGRCKLCGMPYRNDETRYHLNESRNEHEKHAALRARQQIKESLSTASDRRAGMEATGRKSKGTAEKAVKNKTISAARMDTKKWTAEVEKGKKRSKLAIGVAVFVLATSVFSSVMERIDNRGYEIKWAEDNRAEETATVHVDTDELLLLGILDSTSPELVVEDSYDSGTIMPGKYALEASGGTLEVVVQYAQSEDEVFSYILEGEEDQLILELHEGDYVYLGEHRRQADYVLMFQIEQYDETTSM